MLTETCLSHKNYGVKATFSIHITSVNVAEIGDWAAPFPFLLLFLISPGFLVLLSLTDNNVFMALFSLQWNSGNNGMSLITLPLSILEVETPAGLQGSCFFLHCLSFIIN